MSITDTLDDVKASVKELMRKHRFKKANMERKEAAELQSSLAKCRGKLELCRKDFARSVRTQSKNIAEGQRAGMETIIHEQMMWDAAIGYMLINDAIFALKSISTYDSIAHAYEMLETATKQISGKKSGLGSVAHICSTKERNSYGYITSTAAVKEKEELLNSFFEQLKVTGDIEACLAAARNPAAYQAELRGSYTDSSGLTAPAASGMYGSDLDAYMRRLDGTEQAGAEAEDYKEAMGDMLDIHPPKDV